MKISLRYALGILLLSPTFLDAQNGTKYYKVDAVTPDGIVVKHAGRVEWVDAPLSDFERRARILSGKDSGSHSPPTRRRFATGASMGICGE
jgi:hypothetical protein